MVHLRAYPAQYASGFAEEHITAVGDQLAPAAPSGLSATAVDEGIRLSWTNPTTNVDGSTCLDLNFLKVYYRASASVSKAVNDGAYVVGKNEGWTHRPITPGVTKYYIVTAIDETGNESVESGEVNATAASTVPTTNIPDDAGGLIFLDTVGTEGVVTGDGIMGVAFRDPGTAWVNFDHFRLWYAADSGGGFGAWTEIPRVERFGHVHKELDTTYLYKYKATVVATDGTESSTPDYATNNGNAGDGGAGYQPNGADNNNVVAVLIFVETLIATNEIRAAHIKAGTITGDKLSLTSYLSINSATFGNDGIQLDYNAGNPRAYIGDGANAYWKFDGTRITWKAANSELDSSGNLTATSVTLTGTINATAGYFGNASTDVAIDSSGLSVGSTGRIKGGATGFEAGIGFWLGYDGAYKLFIGNKASNHYLSWDGSVLTVKGTLVTDAVDVGATGYVKGGATGYNAGTGFWMGYSGLAHKLFIGTAAGAKLTWDGSTLSVTSLVVGAGSSWAGNAFGAAYIPNLNCDKITSGTFGTVRIPQLAASKITISGGTSLDDWRHSSDVTKIDGGDIYANSVTATQINVTNLAAISADLGTITAGTISAGTISASTITTGTLNFTGGMSRSNLSVAHGEIAANAVRTSELYIDGNVQFKPGATRNEARGIDGLFFSDTGATTDPYIYLQAAFVTMARTGTDYLSIVTDYAYFLGVNTGMQTTSPDRILATNEGGGNCHFDGIDWYCLRKYKEDIKAASGALAKLRKLDVSDYRRVPFVSAEELKDAAIKEFGEERWLSMYPGKESHRGGALYDCPDEEMKAFIDKKADNLRRKRRGDKKWQRRYYGLIADNPNVLTHTPELVSRGKDGNPDGITAESEIGFLLIALKELAQEVDELKGASSP